MKLMNEFEQFFEVFDLLQQGLKDLKDTKLFNEIITKSISLNIIEISQLAHKTGVNSSTVKRWMNGVVAPYHLMRTSVYHAILSQMLEIGNAV